MPIPNECPKLRLLPAVLRIVQEAVVVDRRAKAIDCLVEGAADIVLDFGLPAGSVECLALTVPDKVEVLRCSWM